MSIKRWGSALALLWMAVGGPAAWAQMAVVPDEVSVKALSCLVKPADPPAYPEFDDDRRRAALMRLELRFTAPDRPPQAEVIFSQNASDEMVANIKAYVDRYRLPCLSARTNVRTVQEFEFNPDGKHAVRNTELRSLTQQQAYAWSACMRTPAEGLVFREQMRIGSNLKQRDFGNLLLELRFVDAAQPPVVKVVYDRANAEMRLAALEYVENFRVPCLPAGEQLSMQHLFKLRSYAANSGDRRFKDVGLVTFLKGVDDLAKRPVHFNLDSMACPFQVRWQLGMPAFANWVTELGDVHNPNRAEFLAWLSELTLALNRETFAELLGEAMVITVPCGNVNLG